MNHLNKAHKTMIAMVMSVFAFSASGQTQNAELDALKKQFEREMQSLVETFNQKIDALEQKQDELEKQLQQTEQAPKAAPTRQPEDLRVFWKESLRLETDDGRVKLRIGGRIQFDTAFYDQDDDLRFIWDPNARRSRNIDTEDGAEFRRARIYLSGEVYENIQFKAQYDFAGGDVDFNDVYIALKKIPYVGTLKVGHFKEPFSLEELTSSNYTTFMERALPNVFAPGRNVGIQLNNAHLDDRLTWAVGVFREADNFGSAADDGDFNVTARVTGLPIYTDEGRKLLHLGVSYSHKNPDDPWRYRQRPEAHLSPARFIDTGTFRANDIDIYSFEAAGVYGPFSLQGEYMMADVNTELRGNRDFDGYYLQASYFLTGEHRRYKKTGGAFDKIKPNRNFKFHGDDRGPGAWELALRFSNLDLSDGNFLRGGEEDNITIGLNWYLNPNTRLMFNYINADIDHDLYGGDLNIFQTRFQLFF